MPGLRLVLGLAVGFLCSTSLAWAILIDTGKGRVGGFLLSDDGDKLKISVPTPDGEEKVSEFAHAKIKILHQLDRKRLESLSPDNPKGYRDYAEELARQEADPEARYVAMRLYLITATLAPAEMGSSSLLRMSTLASTRSEARRCRAMAYLIDPKADAEILKAEVVKPVKPAALPARAVKDFVRALRLYRTGQIPLAMEMAKHEGVDKVFSRAPGKINVTKFLQWCADANCTTCKVDGMVVCKTCQGRGYTFNEFVQRVRCPTCNGTKRMLCPDCGGTHFREPLPDEVLHIVLQGELWAMDQHGAGNHAGHKEATDAKGWSAIVQSRRLNPVLPLRLETITHFDPSKNRYRNRKWVEE